MNAAERDEICNLTATETAAAVRSGELSPVEVTDAVLDRIEAVDPQLHAFCTLVPDRARAQARRVADDLAAGRDRPAHAASRSVSRI